jgi:hypothetical protein
MTLQWPKVSSNNLFDVENLHIPVIAILLPALLLIIPPRTRHPNHIIFLILLAAYLLRFMLDKLLRRSSLEQLLLVFSLAAQLIFLVLEHIFFVVLENSLLVKYLRHPVMVLVLSQLQSITLRFFPLAVGLRLQVVQQKPQRHRNLVVSLCPLHVQT